MTIHPSPSIHLLSRFVGAVLLCVCLWPGPVSVSERPRFESQRRDDAIAVDGKFDDWYGHLQPFGTDPVAIQFLNDGEFLYVRLTASDATTRMQIRRLGLTVWFDPSGGTKKKLGIRYPVVEAGAGFGEGRGRRGGGSGRGGEASPEEADAPTDRVDVLGPGKDDARSLTRDHLSGIGVALRMEEGTLHYELKVPLARTADHPYAIETAPGSAIGIGLETGKLEQRPFGSPRGGGFGGGGGGMPGGGRGRGGGGGGSHGGGGQREFQPPKPLKSWGIVAIAPVQ